jgi:thiamine-phosphate diphosphorylase/hydroxyethylthiazole kinase
MTGAAGVHIGQTDCPLPLARRLLGSSAIIGVSVSTPAEARQAAHDGADYVGIGAVWPTQTKDVTEKIKLGPEGVGKILDVLHGTHVQAVAIGESESWLTS